MALPIEGGSFFFSFSVSFLSSVSGGSGSPVKVIVTRFRWVTTSTVFFSGSPYNSKMPVELANFSSQTLRPVRLSMHSTETW